MPIEIERKFLVVGDSWRRGATGTLFRQGYLCTDPERTVRVRLAGDRGTLTIKGLTEGISRAEFEYPIPAAEAAELLDRLCLRPLIEKTRYRLEHAGRIWEIDEFSGVNEGLILAEVELESADAQPELPPWAGKEVSADPRYYNASLVQHPFSMWRKGADGFREDKG
jgi:adenylate cyclase